MEKKTTVIDLAAAPDEKYRKRKCRACGNKFYTIEYEVEYDQRLRNEWVKYNRAYIRRRNESNNRANNYFESKVKSNEQT